MVEFSSLMHLPYFFAFLAALFVLWRLYKIVKKHPPVISDDGGAPKEYEEPYVGHIIDDGKQAHRPFPGYERD